MRLIDKDSIADVKFQYKDNAYKKGWNEAIEAIIKCEPTVDAVEVVRCEYCKHRDPEDKKCDCGMWHIPYVTKDDDYCSYGDRKEQKGTQG